MYLDNRCEHFSLYCTKQHITTIDNKENNSCLGYTFFSPFWCSRVHSVCVFISRRFDPRDSQNSCKMLAGTFGKFLVINFTIYEVMSNLINHTIGFKFYRLID